MWVKNYPAVKWAEIRYLREKVTSTRMPVVAKITIDITMTMTQTLRIDVLIFLGTLYVLTYIQLQLTFLPQYFSVG